MLDVRQRQVVAGDQMIETRAPLPEQGNAPNGTAAAFACPVCHHIDRVEKASAAVRRTSGLLVEADQLFVSELARLLSPPESPRAASLGETLSGIVAGLAVGALILLALTGAGAQGLLDLPSGPLEVASVVTVAWFGLVMPALLLGRYLTSRRHTRLAMPVWRAAIERWSRLYYCFRDDVVFLAPDGTAAPAERARDLLYASHLVESSQAAAR